MASFYLDENVSEQLRPLLERHGHRAIIARSVHGGRTSDHEHVATATRNNWLLVTHDRKDFRLLHRAWIEWFSEFGVEPIPTHADILLIPQPPLASIHEQAAMIQAFLQRFPTKNQRGSRFFVWSMTVGWHEDI